MKDLLKKYLKDTLDEKFILKKYDDIKLPVYIKEDFEIYTGRLMSNDIVFIVSKNNTLKLPAIKKRLLFIEEKTGYKVAVVYHDLSEYVRKNLIKERIPFIIPNKQTYLPFMAYEFNSNTITKPYKDIKSFSPMAQLAFLYILYNNREITIEELAKKTNRTTMTASRAFDELVNVNLLVYEIKGQTGRKKYYKKNSEIDYYKTGYQYLKSPVYKRLKLVSNDYIENGLIAGESALGMLTMVNDSSSYTIAISKETYKNYEKLILSKNNKDYVLLQEEETEIEIWNYDPKLLSNEKYVDVVSLKLSLEDENDERIDYEIDNYIRGCEWYVE